MNEQSRVPISEETEADLAKLKRAGAEALALRRRNGSIMTYLLDGWIVREFPGGRIERLAPEGEFRAADFPHPGSAAPRR